MVKMEVTLSLVAVESPHEMEHLVEFEVEYPTQLMAALGAEAEPMTEEVVVVDFRAGQEANGVL